MEVMECFPPYNLRWEDDGVDYGVCGDAFQKAPMFDGKTFRCKSNMKLNG